MSRRKLTLEILEDRLRTLLPPEYQDSYEDVQPVSMGSAGLKYDEDGRVAWDEIWDHFCDLAMAGGPPHKGKLLEPASSAEIETQPERYREVVKEICRGARMVTDLVAVPSPTPGWVRLDCGDEGMAGWLVRAMVMENVSARLDGWMIDLPAGPHYRVEKEIKNVITVIAKTWHYWDGHMWSTQQQEITKLLEQMNTESPLIQPASWRGVECSSVPSAVWMMRALVATNVLARREETVLFLPVNPETDPTGEIVKKAFAQVQAFAVSRNIS